MRWRTWIVSAMVAVAPVLTLSPPLATGARAQALEIGIDRPGLDYNNFDLTSADPQLCLSACDADLACRAFTYVKPDVQGPSARCWLKNAVPSPVTNDCCVSGVKGAGGPESPPGNERPFGT